MNFKVFHTHKKSSLTYNFVQDKFCINPENKTIAIADGTTQSFRSEFWSELLVQEFCKQPTFETKDFLIFAKSLADNIQSSSPIFSEKAAIASLERDKFSKGSTSTFLGIQFRDQNTFDVINVGDCNLFIIKKNGDIISYPFDTMDSLNNNQSFLNTINLLKEEPDPIEISKVQLKFDDGDILLLCSDSISRLFLSDKKWFNEILNFNSYDLFIKRIEELWSHHILEEDDITIVVMSNILKSSVMIKPPKDFSFPPPPPPRGINITDMDLNTIMHNFNCIQNDFIEIKKKQKFHEILLISIIGILSMILLILIFNFSSDEASLGNSNTESKIEKKLVKNAENKQSKNK